MTFLILGIKTEWSNDVLQFFSIDGCKLKDFIKLTKNLLKTHKFSFKMYYNNFFSFIELYHNTTYLFETLV